MADAGHSMMPPAGPRLRVLWAEDSTEDTELLSAGLDAAGVAHEVLRVEDEPALRAALAGYTPDVVLSDLSIPGFSGERALEVVREVAPQLPFLFVSGTMGEDVAVQALQRGANDYVLKQNPARLPAAVLRAVREAALIAERERQAAELARMQRLDSLAHLVADLGVEIRNLLQPLAVTPSLLRHSPDPSNRQIAEVIDDCVRQGGRMVESMLTFVQLARAGAPASATAPSAPVANPDLLLLHDDATRLKLTANALVAQGYRVLTAAGPAQAVAALSEAALPALVIVDLEAGAGHAREFLGQLEARGYSGPAIVLYDTEGPRIDAVPPALEIFYLAKPVGLARLIETVGRLHPAPSPVAC